VISSIFLIDHVFSQNSVAANLKCSSAIQERLSANGPIWRERPPMYKTLIADGFIANSIIASGW
jgi:hypothetical protein